MLKNLIIIGTGGLGRETALIVEDINKVSKEWNLLGFIDDNKDIQGKTINGYKVLGGLDYITNCEDEVFIVCAIASYQARKNITNKIKNNPNIKFANIIHPTTTLNQTVELGQGCIIYPNCIITANIKIGDHVIISPKCGIGHDSIIENYTTLLWNVNVSGNVLLKEGATMGSGSTIIQGKTVGKNSYIGAGSVVIRDIEENKKVAGVPSRYI